MLNATVPTRLRITAAALLRLFLNAGKQSFHAITGVAISRARTMMSQIRVTCLMPANVGVQGDLWQAQPDTGSALERIVRAVVPGTLPPYQRCPRL